MATKCADGKQLGRIPTCSKCNGGKLRFDRATEMYKCPGYMEDTDFVHCNEDFRFNEVKRLDWVEWWWVSIIFRVKDKKRYLFF